MDIKDIKSKVDEVVKKIQSDDKLLDQFKKEPIKTVEELAGVDLPDDQIQKVVDGIKAKIAVGDISEKLSGLKDLFGKK